MSKNFICKDSLNLKLFEQFLTTVDTLNFEISWYQWQKQDKKCYAVIEKVKKFGSGKGLITHIMSMREKYTTHASIKCKQSKCFKLSITKSMNPSLTQQAHQLCKNVKKRLKF